MSSFFEVLHKSKKSKARLGEIKTNHGMIKTPAFVPCATKGTLKTLLPSLIKEIGTQVAFVNTYHLVTHPGTETITKAGGIHNYAKLDIPLMSDSGGFQVFSLARDMRARQRKADVHGEEQPFVVKISDDGVKFRSAFDGTLVEFTPELSMKYQHQIGADINMAFDECIPYGSSYEYSKKATERTHRWLERSIKTFKSLNVRRLKGLKTDRFNCQTFKHSNITTNEYLYGVIQGGVYEDLRKKSAEFVCSQDTSGVAIGGVSVGETKKEMRDQVKWMADYLPKDRPVHLLGVGQFDDIIDLVKYGIDTFDCVEPTRLARAGRIYTHSLYEIDIFKGKYKNDLSSVDENCNCYVCTNFTKSYLHHLFKQKEILGYTLATYHNLWVMERFFDRIREMILNSEL